MNGTKKKRAPLFRKSSLRCRYRLESVVSGLKTNLYLRFRNANGVKSSSNGSTSTNLKTLHTQEFWQERGNFIGDLSGGKMNVIFDQILFKQFVPERKSGYIKRADRKFSDWLDAFELIGDEVALPVALSPTRITTIKLRVDFPVGEPGAYLVEIAATGGNKDAAIVWLHDFVVAHERLEKGVRCLALDAITGEPLAEQPLEFFVFNRDAKDDVPAIKEYAKQTDETGALFFLTPNIPNDDAVVVLVTVPKDGAEKTSAAQTAFIGSQGIWRSGPLPTAKIAASSISIIRRRSSSPTGTSIARTKRLNSNSSSAVPTTTRPKIRCGRVKRSISKLSARAERLS